MLLFWRKYRNVYGFFVSWDVGGGTVVNCGSAISGTGVEGFVAASDFLFDLDLRDFLLVVAAGFFVSFSSGC